jgi:hypothetical protein
VQVQLKTILNQVQHLVGFIYQEIELSGKKGQRLAIKVQIAEHAGHLARPKASTLLRSAAPPALAT